MRCMADALLACLCNSVCCAEQTYMGADTCIICDDDKVDCDEAGVTKEASSVLTARITHSVL
jgi:hypothetical protein